jgi:hypothetical protein
MESTDNLTNEVSDGPLGHMEAAGTLSTFIDADHPFYCGPDSMVAPHLPVGSPEREALFRELRRTFAEDWAAAEASLKEERRQKFGDLYFVGAGNAVKIGRTTNFGVRLRHIQAHNHENVECLAVLKGQGWRERDLHRRFRDHHLRGEWFERCPEIEAEIDRLNAPTPGISGEDE